MNFARPHLQDEFERRLHPEARKLIQEFEKFSRVTDPTGPRLPTPCITAVSRTLDFYALNKLPTLLSSWHLYDSAADLRITIYTADELDRAISWFIDACKDRNRWELITNLHGTGPHIHVARRDQDWKGAFKKGVQV